MHFTEDVKRYKILKDIPAGVDGKGSVIPQRHVLYRAEPKSRVCKKPCTGALEVKDRREIKKRSITILTVFIPV